MKLQFPQTPSNSENFSDLTRYVSVALDKLQNTLNGNVDLIDNGANDHLSFTFNKINVDVGVPHTLGRIPRGYMQTSSTNHVLSLQNGKQANTAQTLYLQAGSTGIVNVLVF